MSRTAKIAGVAALAGLMMTVAIVAAVQPDEPAPAPPLFLPADWTAGCISVTNREIEDIYAMVKDGTPITITQ